MSNPTIPRWCSDIAKGLVADYGADQALLEGAIAAALQNERDRLHSWALDTTMALSRLRTEMRDGQIGAASEHITNLQDRIGRAAFPETRKLGGRKR